MTTRTATRLAIAMTLVCVALAVKQRLAEGLIDRDPERAHTVLAEAQADTIDALQTIRDLAHGIYPPVLADQGLAAALNAQVRRAAIPVEVHADGIERYGQDVEAAVELSVADGWLSFAVSDDGAGFDPSTVARGTGLLGMADRVEALGGSLDVGSRPGTGTTVTVGMNLHEASRERPSSANDDRTVMALRPP